MEVIIPLRQVCRYPSVIPRTSVAAAIFLLLVGFSHAVKASTEELLTEKIISANYWNSTGVTVKEGHTYKFDVASPVDSAGNIVGLADWYVHVTTLHGYDRWYLRPFFFLRRRPHESWFSLIGTVGKRDPFRILAGKKWVASRTGQLICYFNDCPLLYWNNVGYVRLHVKDLGERGSRKTPATRFHE
jgi:hypothetical protein